ncbi:hypothetical protein EJD97_023994 [Solanum chilense]|uniref:Uncharacterized protein n=1 Tax=Solanum chilense TaxID=4083 RepID=A0A6N2ATE0_SOLCI|nr:hypothetical protein EJD97_023994 [Solanum chilense]
MVQKIVGDKAVNQVEKALKSKFEATLARQIQVMLEQVYSIVQKGFNDHTVAAQQQLKSVHSPLEISMRDNINPALAMTQTMSGEFANSRQLLSLAVSGANSQSTNQLNHMNNGSLIHEKIETPPDLTKE